MYQQFDEQDAGSDVIFERGNQGFETLLSRSSVFTGVPNDATTLCNDGCHNPLTKNAGKGHRILIIEDDPLSLELYDFLLKSFGYATNLATNGEEGLAKARSTGPDLILCDIRLPRLGGVEVMKQVKADHLLRHIPIIALTIFSSTGHRERLLEAGFDGYIPKPTIPEVFIQQIMNFLS